MHLSPPRLSEVERGRQVYIGEGCINCHSQYVRPHTADETGWPTSLIAQVLKTSAFVPRDGSGNSANPKEFFTDK
jgi:Cytochrome C oxidase, mono-heme subunit/FixO